MWSCRSRLRAAAASSVKPLLERIERGEIDPSFVITHRLSLDDAPKGYQIFRDKQDHCIKVVMKPHGETVH